MSLIIQQMYTCDMSATCVFRNCRCVERYIVCLIFTVSETHNETKEVFYECYKAYPTHLFHYCSYCVDLITCKLLKNVTGNS